jgi:hypothetical protein
MGAAGTQPPLHGLGEDVVSTDPRLVEPTRVTPPSQHPPADPLRLCVLATVALVGWLLGPFALVAFAGVAFAGYWKARRAGLRRSRCKLGDTRLVLAYLGLLVVAGTVGIALHV